MRENPLPLLHRLFFQRYILYAPSNRIAHITAFSRWAVAKTRISSMGQPRGIDPAIHCTTNGSSSTELHLAFRCAMRAVYCQSLLPTRRCATTRDRSGDPLHHERKLFHGATSRFPLRDADRTLSVSTTNTSVCDYFGNCRSENATPSLVSYFSFQPVLHDWCNKGRGICYPVCRMVHIKEPLLLIGKSSPCGPTPYNRK